MIVKIKRGEGFAVEMDLFEADGVTPIVVTGRALQAQLRNREALVATLTVVPRAGVAAQNGVLVTAASTSAWPLSDTLNVLKFDVAVIAPGAQPLKSGDVIVQVDDEQTEVA